KQGTEDGPTLNAHQSRAAAALATNSSLTDGFYFAHVVAQAAERKPVLSSPRHCRDVAHAQTGLAQTRRFLSYFNPRRHPQPSAQPSLRRLSRTACPACSGIAMSA